MLLYRTQEFKIACFKRPNELETLLSWDKVYGSALQCLRLRVIAEEANDFSGKCDILDEDILKRTGARMEEWANDSFNSSTHLKRRIANWITRLSLPPANQLRLLSLTASTIIPSAISRYLLTSCGTKWNLKRPTIEANLLSANV